jgi:hypothetical protein
MEWSHLESLFEKSIKMKMDFMKRNSTYAYCWFKSPCVLGWLERVKMARKGLRRTKQG